MPVRGTIVTLALWVAAVPLPAQNLTGVKAIVANGNRNFALLHDGTVWGWGQEDDWNEVLGGGRSTPLRVNGLTDVVSIGPPLALKADGTVWTFSTNFFYYYTPVRVDELSGAVAVAGGWGGLALKSDGTVWGRYYGQSGWTAAPVSGLGDVAAITSLEWHNLAMKRDGTVWEWGKMPALPATVSPDFSLDIATPTQVAGLTDVIAIAAGYGHSLALKNDGTVWAWGFNGHGELGDGTTQTRTTPAQVSGIDGVVKIAAGHGHSLAVKRDGTVWAWGLNVAGQVGDGTTTDRLNPVQVNALSGITAVAGGRFHSLAMGDDCTVWAWGSGQFGELGNGVALPYWWQDRRGPFQVAGLTGVAKIAAGWSHSLALKADGTVSAWGDNYSGALGDGLRQPYDWPDRSVPVQASGLTEVAAIAGNERGSLAVTRDGTVWRWGQYTDIRTGGSAYAVAPVQVSGLSGVVSASGGSTYNPGSGYRSAASYYLALREDGSLWEWGVLQRYDWWPMETTALDPVPLAGLNDVATAVTALNQNLAVKRDGTVWEWGIRNPAPAQVSGLTGVVAVAAACGDAYYPVSCHSLVLKGDGTVWAWGNNFNGELGEGTVDWNVTTAYRAMPVQVAELSDVVAIATRASVDMIGRAHSVAVKRDGTVWEWPSWDLSSLSPVSVVPVQVEGLSDIVAVAEGGAHSLALKSDGTVWAWGQNIFGQLGVQTLVIRATPAQVLGPASQ